jgi:ABC-type uncharacterized transport system substrate-binding protein
MAARHPDALQVIADSFLYDQGDRINAFALAPRLPTLASAADSTYGGALLAYGLSVTELHRRSGYYVKRILEGEPRRFARRTGEADRASNRPQDCKGSARGSRALLAQTDDVIE